MPTSLFATCSDGCGWAGAVIAPFAFGSFGVPLKTSVKVEVDPLVMQTYKTLVCFATCWLVIFMGEEVRWTPWGIVSGLFWVPGAACGIYGIRNAGLAIAVGTWASIIVLTSFLWGIVIFKEQVRSFSGACGAFLLLIAGLIGMSRYSKPVHSQTQPRKFIEDDESSTESSDEESAENLLRMATKRKSLKRLGSGVTEKGPIITGPIITPLEVEQPLLKSASKSNLSQAKDLADKDRIVFCRGRIAATRRQLGIVGAVINGVWGANNLIPLHYAAQEGFGGASYLISCASGALIVNIFMWVFYFMYYVYDKRCSMRDAYESMPSFYVKELGGAGLMAGLLYSMGNFASIMAVSYLGQGVGYSFCQTSILVSGLWGIFFFKEITGRETIIKWLLSATVTVIGIIWLSYEHQSGSPAH
jgi:glucose uptake protein GlcU